MKKIMTHSINPAELVDFHCHLDLYPNYLEIVRESESLGIKTLTVTNAPCVWKQNQMLVKDCKHIRVALGLHPQLVHVKVKEIELFEQLLPETRYVGEVGLDGSPEYADSIGIQRQAFQTILELCASMTGKVLTVHSRRASRQVIELIGNYLPPEKGRVVLHWFTGSIKEAMMAVELGCYFSINLKMLETPRKRELVESLPKERILTESDGPFVKFDKKFMSPKDMWKPVQELAGIWSETEANAARIIRNNLKTLLS